MAVSFPEPVVTDRRRARASQLVLLEPREDVPTEPRAVEAGQIRVLIADGQPVVRAGLRAMLDSEADMLVVADASQGDEAVSTARAVRPDVALLDADISGLDVLETT